MIPLLFQLRPPSIAQSVGPAPRPIAGEQNRYIRLAYSDIDIADIEDDLVKFKARAER